jgi:hypothetical protein
LIFILISGKSRGCSDLGHDITDVNCHRTLVDGTRETWPG